MLARSAVNVWNAYFAEFRAAAIPKQFNATRDDESVRFSAANMAIYIVSRNC